MLKISTSKNTQRLEEGLTDLRSTIASKDKALAQMMKEKKALKGELQVAQEKLIKDIQAATHQAKLWAAKSVTQARIKMAKEAADAGFEKAEWDVVKWQRTLANIGEAGDEQATRNVSEMEASKGDEVEQAKEDEGEKVATVGDEGVMQA